MTEHGPNIIFKSLAQQVVESRTGRALPEMLADLYGQGMTQAEIADQLGVSRASVNRWMRDYRIPTRYMRRGPQVA